MRIVDGGKYPKIKRRSVAPLLALAERDRERGGGGEGKAVQYYGKQISSEK